MNRAPRVARPVHRPFKWTVLILLALAASNLNAQEQAPSSLPRVNDPEEAAALTVSSGDDPAQAVADPAAQSLSSTHVCAVSSPARASSYDPAVVEAAKEACLEWLRYERDKYATQIEPEFAWQAFSTRAIFVTVLVLVALGGLLACVQFWIAMRLAAAAPTDEDTPDPAETGETTKATGRWAWLSNNITIGPDGVSLRSSFLGVVLLVISLAFFYLYLVHVYPIRILE